MAVEIRIHGYATEVTRRPSDALNMWARKSDDDSYTTLLGVVGRLLDHLSEHMTPEVLAKILEVKVEDVVVGGVATPAERTTLTTEQRDFPTCPSCGHRHADAWEWTFANDVEVTMCDSCHLEIRVERYTSVTYTTRVEK